MALITIFCILPGGTWSIIFRENLLKKSGDLLNKLHTILPVLIFYFFTKFNLGYHTKIDIIEYTLLKYNLHPVFQFLSNFYKNKWNCKKSFLSLNLFIDKKVNDFWKYKKGCLSCLINLTLRKIDSEEILNLVYYYI